MKRLDTWPPAVPCFCAPAWRRALLAFAALAAATAVLSACGGGGVGTGGTGSFTSGPITGFGSVIVNEVRFEDVQAVVEDGDGVHRSRDELRLGMTVEIDSDVIVTTASGATATASRIRLDSELVGPVGAVDVAGSGFTVFGQRVDVDATTVFDERLGSGLAGLAGGDTLQVFALYDATTARYRATRVEPAASTQAWHLRGPVAELNAGAKTLRIGGVVYSYDGAGGQMAPSMAGQFVRLNLGSAGAGGFAVTRFGTALQALADVDATKYKGLITQFSSLNAFEVNGRAVTAAGASFPGGTALAVGVRVEVEGRVRLGALQASKVTVLSDQQERDRGFELSGPITGINILARTFVVRGQTVGTGRSDLRYVNGSVTDLRLGQRVVVKGLLSADGRRVDATEIRFE